MIYAKALCSALRQLLEQDPRVVLLGEDIADPYGGAFKVTRGLSTDYPDRVRTTPVSEAAIVGIAGGLALQGFRPIVEIMFGDFLSLGFDQIVNHIAKFQLMYNSQAACPVIIRTPSGGGRGYGPTHSQSLEKHFLGVPHLRVIAASAFHDPLATLEAILSQDAPALFVEHKLLYPAEPRFRGSREGEIVTTHEGTDALVPAVSLSWVPRRQCSVTVAAYGYQAGQTLPIIRRLAIEEEVFAELVVPGQLSPLDLEPIVRSVEATGSLVTVEEGVAGWAWGSDLSHHISGQLFRTLRHPPRVLSSDSDVIPAAKHRESKMMINSQKIERAIREAAK